jgi:hypothetical protein
MGRRRIYEDDAAWAKAHRDRIREDLAQARKDLALARRRAEKAEAKVRELKSRKPPGGVKS